MSELDPKKVKRKQHLILWGGIGLFLLVLVGGMMVSDPNKGKPSAREMAREKSEEVIKNYTVNSSSSISAKDSWIAQSENELTASRRDNAELRRDVESILKKLERFENGEMAKGASAVSSGAGTPISLPPPPTPYVPPNPVEHGISPSLNNIAKAALPPAPNMVDGNYPRQGVKAEPVTLIEVVDLTPDKPEEAAGLNNISSYIPAGSFATAVLLSGVDAPTGGLAQTNPVPILLRLMDDGQLPNYFNSEVRDCHVTGAAVGNISSERAEIRLELLSCVLTNGDVIEASVKGYVTGEDGKNGMRGRLVSKQGSLIAKSALAGMFSGIGTSVESQSQQVMSNPLGIVTSVDPNKAMEAGIASGFSSSMEKIADFYISRANETYPIIEVDAKRIGEIVFTQGVDLGAELIGNIKRGSR